MSPAGKDWIFVGDAHFTGRDPQETKPFQDFLDSEKERLTHLVILGDLFEFLFGFKHVLAGPGLHPFPDYHPVLEKLQQLNHQGIRIKYFEGNHDFNLRSFFSDQLGMEVEVNPEGKEDRLEGKKAYLAHGDLSNPGQWTHRISQGLLKNRWTYSLLQLLGPGLTRGVARRLSDRSHRRYHAGVLPDPPPAFKTFAHQKFLEGFEIVILGHSHFPERVEEWVDGRRCLYFNVGAWRTHRSFLRFTPPDTFELSRYPEEG